MESNGQFTTIEKLQEKNKTAPKIEQKSIKSREQILDEEIEEFFRNHALQVSIGIPGNNIEQGKTYTARILVQEYGRPFTGTLPAEGLELAYDGGGVKIFPDKVLAIENGVREFQITGKKTGKYGVSFKIGKKIFLSTTINVYKMSEMKLPDTGIIINPASMVLADEKTLGVVFQTKYASNQIDIPYTGVYTLKTLTGKVKFCNVSNRVVKKCASNELVDELTFTYADTYRGVLVFRAVALDYMPASFVVTRGGKTVARSQRDTVIANPIGLDKNYPYFAENISALRHGFYRLNSGYVLQDRTLINKQARDLVYNFGVYLSLRSGDDFDRKTLLQKYLDALAKLPVGDEYATVTRGQFAKMLLAAYPIPLVQNTDKKWIDESGIYKDYMTTLRQNYHFAWRDQFGDRYFQSDKEITVGEALYLMEVVAGKY